MTVCKVQGLQPLPTYLTMTCGQDLHHIITKWIYSGQKHLRADKFHFVSLSCNPSCNPTSCSHSLLPVEHRYFTSYLFNLRQILDLTHVKKMISVLLSLHPEHLTPDSHFYQRHRFLQQQAHTLLLISFTGAFLNVQRRPFSREALPPLQNWVNSTK